MSGSVSNPAASAVVHGGRRVSWQMSRREHRRVWSDSVLKEYGLQQIWV